MALVSSHSLLAGRQFAITLPARYVVARYPAVRGRGSTISIGKDEIVLGVDQRLEPGEWVQVSVQWPVVRENLHSLELEASGEVLRSSDESAAIRIEACDLRAVFADEC